MSEFKKLGVIGHPISHSKSPLIHNYWIKKHGLSGLYEALDIAPENFEQEIRALIASGYHGFNLTVPHKTMALALCDEVDDIASAVGAVNTIKIADGEMMGTNTDVFGFIENIEAAQPDFDFTSAPAVILGAGGAARAAVYGLLLKGAPEIIILNRTREKAEQLAQMSASKIKVMSWDARGAALVGAGLLVNTTSLGMSGNLGLDINLENLPKTAIVNDIVYAPLYTDFLRAAQTRGNPVVTGIGMLLHQARPAFENWFGVLPDVDDVLQKMVLA